jgi:pleiotropic regulator 1
MVRKYFRKRKLTRLGNFIQNVSGHNAILNALAINSDGVMVSGADNGTMQWFDWRTGYNFQRYQAPVQPGSLDSESGIFALAFDKSESRLISCEGDKVNRVALFRSSISI